MDRLWTAAFAVSVFALPCYLEMYSNTFCLLAILFLHVGYFSILSRGVNKSSVLCLLFCVPFFGLNSLLTLFYLYREISRLWQAAGL